VSRVHVTSEIGPLRSVLMHTPGAELLAVTPGTREDYLYDDVIDLELARKEHRQLVAVLRQFAEVLETRSVLADILRRPEVRERLRQSLDAWGEGEAAAGGFSLDFAAAMVTAVATEANAWCVGKRLDEIARERGQDPLDATLDLLVEEEGHVSGVFWAMREDDVREFLRHPLGCLGTDGLAFAPYGPLSTFAARVHMTWRQRLQT
jgi:N-acyl-D-aspartate/D-glutamate deacylase